jgi:hypothetical protein
MATAGTTARPTAVQYHKNADNRWRGGSLALSTLIEQFCFAQVEFAFDAAP